MTAPVHFLPVLGFVKAELVVNCIIVSLVLLVVGLRVVGRVMGPGIGWDDALVIFAIPLGVVMLVCQGMFAPIGNGYDLRENPQLIENVPFILELTFGMQIIYVILLASVKASMLCFFIRVFITTFMQRASKIMLVFCALWVISYLGACIFLCAPISAQWTGPQEKCGKYIPMIQSLIATNAIGDLVIMALPMKSVWGLKTQTTDKIGITSCFALGLACVVCAIFRLIYISTVDLNSNMTGTMPTTIFFFILEPNLAILCISIPMLRPFYAKYKKRAGGSRLNEDSSKRSTGFRDQSSGTASKVGMGSKAREPGWELGEYYPLGKAGHNTTVAGFGEDSGSEQELTSNSLQQRIQDEIKVETRWTVTHST